MKEKSHFKEAWVSEKGKVKGSGNPIGPGRDQEEREESGGG